MKILGISAFYHDSAAALIEDGHIIAAAQEERFTRKKHDSSFPTNAISFCLEEAGATDSDIEAIAFYDKPLLKFERLLETYYAFAPKGLTSFISAMPVWLNEKMFLKRLIKKKLKELGFERSPKLMFPEHHLSHAASAYYPTRFGDAAIITVDGVGEWATASICHGDGKEIKVLREQKFPHSIGLLYSAFTYFLGFRVNSGEYKLMGLAPYGIPGSAEVKKFEEIISQELIDLKPDGSLWLDQKYFNYATGLRMVHEGKWEKLFGMKRRKPDEKIEQRHCNLGLAIQRVTEEVVLRLGIEAKRLTNSRNLCMAGGVALNCVSNGKLQKANLFDNIYIQPAAGDAGGALGAAQAVYHISYSRDRVKPEFYDLMKGAYLGPSFTDKEITRALNKLNARYQKLDERKLVEKVASLLDKGKVIGWFQGRMEFGPRALGGRSILGDARNEKMQKKLNLKIKYRESFRPFAPSVLNEVRKEYFEINSESPYMLLVQPVTQTCRKELPDNYHELELRDKLYHVRSEIPAVTHIDFSARIQTVHRETNPRYWELINSFKALTGTGLIVNTSFNVRGEPIVCTPEDAYRCFMRTEMDYLVIEDYILSKQDQPDWEDKVNWKEEFVLD